MERPDRMQIRVTDNRWDKLRAIGYLIHGSNIADIVDYALSFTIAKQSAPKVNPDWKVELETVSQSAYQALAKMVQVYGRPTVEAALETLPPDVGEQFEVQGLTVGDWNTRNSGREG